MGLVGENREFEGVGRVMDGSQGHHVGHERGVEVLLGQKFDKDSIETGADEDKLFADVFLHKLLVFFSCIHLHFGLNIQEGFHSHFFGGVRTLSDSQVYTMGERVHKVEG